MDNKYRAIKQKDGTFKIEMQHPLGNSGKYSDWLDCWTRCATEEQAERCIENQKRIDKNRGD